MVLGYEAHLAAGCMKDQGQTNACRTLAVGSSDQRAAESTIDGAESVEDVSGRLRPQLHAEPAEARHVGDRLVERHRRIGPASNPRLGPSLSHFPSRASLPRAQPT